MDPESILDTLLERDVLSAPSATDELSISDSFDETVDRERTAIEDAESPRSHLEGLIDDPDTVDTLCAVADDAEFLAHYCALVDRAPNLSAQAALRATVVLLQYRGDPPEARGAPEGFLPVKGDRLETLIQLNERAVVYAWLDDCQTCKLMQEDLADVLADEHDVSLFAVYGPNWAEELQAFDVEGGPTTLFVLDGQVDARLHGAHYPAVIESELETLRELSSA